MKQLNHIFTNQFNKDRDYDFIGYTEVCIYCGRKAGSLYNQLPVNNNFPQPMRFNGNTIYNKQVEYLNEYIKCITEDEYIIKNIIE